MGTKMGTKEGAKGVEKIGTRGFTLIEMMVGVVITGMVVLAAATFYIHNQQFQARHELQKELRVRLQLGMESLVQEIRHAGYGAADPFSKAYEDETKNPCLVPTSSEVGEPIYDVFRENGLCAPVMSGNAAGPDASDTITLLQTGSGGSSFGQLTLLPLQAGAGITTLTVNSPNADISFPEGGPVRLISFAGLAAMQAIRAVPNGTPNQYVITLASPFHFPNVNDGNEDGGGLTIGTPLRAYTIPVGGGSTVFTIGPNPQGGQPALLMNGALFVSGIEDLQVAYLLTPQAIPGTLQIANPAVPLPTNPFLKNAYLAIRVSMIARARDPDPMWTGGQRPQLEDHPAGNPNDNFRRAVLTRVVELKNDTCKPGDAVCS